MVSGCGRELNALFQNAASLKLRPRHLTWYSTMSLYTDTSERVASTIFKVFGMTQPRIKPTTFRSQSGRSTKWAIVPVPHSEVGSTNHSATGEALWVSSACTSVQSDPSLHWSLKLGTGHKHFISRHPRSCSNCMDVQADLCLCCLHVISSDSHVVKTLFECSSRGNVKEYVMKLMG